MREFAFDKSYWSHDGFDTDPDTAYMSPQAGSQYADQDKVMKDFGIPLIDNAFEGYNVCMFAYGQTGSGKSTIMRLLYRFYDVTGGEILIDG